MSPEKEGERRELGLAAKPEQERGETTPRVHPEPQCSEFRLKGLQTGCEKAMAPHSSTFAWKIPWTEEPGRLQSMGSRRVGHD